MTMAFDPRLMVQFYGVAIMCAVMLWAFRKRISYLATGLWGYLMLSCVAIAWSPLWRGASLNEFEVMAMQYHALQTFFLVVALPFIVFIVRTKLVMNLCVAFLCVDAIYMMFNDFGLINAKTYDAVFMALFLPWVFFYRNTYLKMAISALFVATILSVFAKTAIVAIIAMILTVIFMAGYRAFSVYITLLGVAVGVAMYHYDILGVGHGSGRYELWKMYWEVWSGGVNKWVGSGLSTLEIYGRKILVLKEGESLSNHSGHMIYNLHNNYFQMLFEGGILGLSIMLLFMGRVIHSLYKAKSLFCIIAVGYAVSMLFYSPLNSFIGQLLALVIILRSTIGERDAIQNQSQ